MMIIRAEPEGYILTTQHDHAHLSGWAAALWGNETIAPPPGPTDALRLATLLHDVAWVDLDAGVVLNPQTGAPYSFIDLPADTRLPMYRRGVDRVAALESYAGLLCSLHYSALLASMADDPVMAAFLNAERTRQEHLVSDLRRAGRTAEVGRRHDDRALLRLWDELSLYVALNLPGAPKAAEHPWFRDGFTPVPAAAVGGSPRHQPVRFQAHWQDARRVALQPFPFRGPVSYGLPFRWVSRTALVHTGWDAGWRQAELQVQMVTFVPG